MTMTTTHVTAGVAVTTPGVASTRSTQRRGSSSATPGTPTPSTPARRQPHRPALTSREIRVLELVAFGWTNADIADELGLTHNTVKTYLQRALEKLGAHGRIQACILAGLLTPRADLDGHLARHDGTPLGEGDMVVLRRLGADGQPTLTPVHLGCWRASSEDGGVMCMSCASALGFRAAPAAVVESQPLDDQRLVLEPAQCRCLHGEDWHLASGCEARGCPCDGAA